MNVKLEAGQWYRNRDGFVRYVIGIGPLMGKPKEDAYPFLVLGDAVGADVVWCREDGKCYDDESNEDLVEHLPCCDGFDWKPPKPIEAPDGWGLLNEGEKIKYGDMAFSGGAWNVIDSHSVVFGEKFSLEDHLPIARKIGINLQMREGAWYERQDGKIVGPCEPYSSCDVMVYHPAWKIAPLWYDDKGENTNPESWLIREVDPPHKDYRKFANRDEALAHCDGWWIDESGNAVKVMRVSDSGIVFGVRGFVDFHDALVTFKRQDGTPFGVVVENE
jgi:hypothetical protein